MYKLQQKEKRGNQVALHVWIHLVNDTFLAAYCRDD